MDGFSLGSPYLRLTSFPPPPCWPRPPASWTLQPPGPPAPSPSASPRSGTAEINTVWVKLVLNKHFTIKARVLFEDKSGFSVCENSLQSQISKYLSFKKSSLLQRLATSIASISAFSVWADLLSSSLSSLSPSPNPFVRTNPQLPTKYNKDPKFILNFMTPRIGSFDCKVYLKACPVNNISKLRANFSDLMKEQKLIIILAFSAVKIIRGSLVIEIVTRLTLK